MTNGDRIRSINDEELAEFIDNVYLDGYYDGQHDTIYGTMYDKEWLKQEADNESKI